MALDRTLASRRPATRTMDLGEGGGEVGCQQGERPADCMLRAGDQHVVPAGVALLREGRMCDGTQPSLRAVAYHGPPDAARGGEPDLDRGPRFASAAPAMQLQTRLPALAAAGGGEKTSTVLHGDHGDGRRG